MTLLGLEKFIRNKKRKILCCKKLKDIKSKNRKKYLYYVMFEDEECCEVISSFILHDGDVVKVKKRTKEEGEEFLEVTKIF